MFVQRIWRRHGLQPHRVHQFMLSNLGAVQRLVLRFLIDREDDGMGGRIDIKPDNVAQLVDEPRVVACR
jgi:hypothetical protein